MSLEDSLRRDLAERAADVSATPDVDALLQRGMQARRRRRTLIASVTVTVLIAITALVPRLWPSADSAPVIAVPPTPLVTTRATAAESTRGISYFLGSRPDWVTYNLPAGWETVGTWVWKTDSSPEISMAFIDVANIYTDGCRWQLVAPRPGPSVADLVAAYAQVPGAEPPTAVTLDGFSGSAISVTIPDYDAQQCREGKFGLGQHDGETGLGQTPSFGATVPGGRYTVYILDVEGSRLVIFVEYPPNTTDQDRADFDEIVSSVDLDCAPSPTRGSKACRR